MVTMTFWLHVLFMIFISMCYLTDFTNYSFYNSSGSKTLIPETQNEIDTNWSQKQIVWTNIGKGHYLMVMVDWWDVLPTNWAPRSVPVGVGWKPDRSPPLPFPSLCTLLHLFDWLWWQWLHGRILLFFGLNCFWHCTNLVLIYINPFDRLQCPWLLKDPKR